MKKTLALVVGIVGAMVLTSASVGAQVSGASTPAGAAAPTDLPLVELPPTAPGELLTLMVSGDGGWAPIDKGVAGRLNQDGLPVVGLNALKYFWTRRQPEEAARDLERILRYYLPAWNRREVLLVGYSRGADVLPFMINRLPEDLRHRIRLVALLGPGETVDLKFHLADWWGETHHRTDLAVLPEAEKLLPGTRLLCAYGAEEKDSICPTLASRGAEPVELKGAHHFDGGYEALGEIVLRALTTHQAGS